MDLAAVAREAFGGGRRLAGVERLRGGSKKGVHRLLFEDGGTAVAYVWSAAENHWPGADEPADDADPLARLRARAVRGGAPSADRARGPDAAGAPAGREPHPVPGGRRGGRGRDRAERGESGGAAVAGPAGRSTGAGPARRQALALVG